MMCNENETQKSYMTFDAWTDSNILEIIHRSGEFSTVTVKTENGPRSFRSTGVNSLVDAVKKAKSYMGVA